MPKMREMQPRSKLGGDVVQYLENEKLCKPSTVSSELQQRLLMVGQPDEQSRLTKSAISKCIREDLVMAKNKIQQVPLQAKKPINVEHADFFLDQVSDLPPTTIHFFDDNSVVKWKCTARRTSI